MEELKKELAELKEVQRIEDSEQQQQQQQRVEVLEKELAELKQQQRIDALEQELQALKSEKSPDQRSAVKNSSASASMRRSISSRTVSGKRRAISAPSGHRHFQRNAQSMICRFNSRKKSLFFLKKGVEKSLLTLYVIKTVADDVRWRA